MNIKIDYPIKRSGVDYVSYDCALEIKSQYNISEIIFRLTEHVNFDGAYPEWVDAKTRIVISYPW